MAIAKGFQASRFFFLLWYGGVLPHSPASSVRGNERSIAKPKIEQKALCENVLDGASGIPDRE
jgi:hypothetical protein